MMTINYDGNISILIEAAKKANELLAGNILYDSIMKKDSFDFTTASGSQIAQSMQKCSLQLNVITFKRYFTRELGFEDPNDPTSIHINIAQNKLNRSLGSIAGTYIHEAVHAADSDDERLDFPHEGNKSTGNENTAPYWIGNLAIQLIDQPDSAVNVDSIAVVPHAPDDTLNDQA